MTNDRLQEYLRTHAPNVPKAPADEWWQIQQRIRSRRPSPHRRLLWGVPAAALGLALVLTFRPAHREAEPVLGVDDVVYRELEEGGESPAYRDWLWLADHVDQAADD